MKKHALSKNILECAFAPKLITAEYGHGSLEALALLKESRYSGYISAEFSVPGGDPEELKRILSL